jgi:uncharacterized membrane protein YeiH
MGGTESGVDPQVLSAQVLVVLDLIGTLVFAVSGGLVAARARLDVFGFLVLALAAGCAGGVLRDLLIGDTPPVAITDWRYAAVCAAGGLGVFAFGQQAARVVEALRVVDAVGLGIFAVAGTVKSLEAGLGDAASVGLGVLTAIGGGIVRDVLSGTVPVVLRADIYAVAAAVGALTLVLATHAGQPLWLAAVGGAAVTTALRLAAIRFAWQAPRQRETPDRP